jgi:hypothetical protein
MACCVARHHELEEGSGVGFLDGLFGTSKRLAEAASSQVVKRLATKLDVDILNKSFARFAGGDEVMEADECVATPLICMRVRLSLPSRQPHCEQQCLAQPRREHGRPLLHLFTGHAAHTLRFARFTKWSNITRQEANLLWQILDRDGSGAVEQREFQQGLASLQQARSWLRYCPDCVYANTCAFCLECNANCELCTDASFCTQHWTDHPARNASAAVETTEAEKRFMNTSEVLRQQLVIRPLNWAYTRCACPLAAPPACHCASPRALPVSLGILSRHSPLTGWLPISQKALLRQALRKQQLAHDEAIRVAREEEESAHRMQIGQKR